MHALNFNHEVGYEARVSSHHLLKSLAKAALKHVPNSEKVIQRYFEPTPVTKALRQAPQPNLIMHDPHNNVAH